MRTLILFSDRHFDTFSGRSFASVLQSLAHVKYVEEDYGELLVSLRSCPDAVLVVSSMLGTPGNEFVPDEVEPAVLAHLQKGCDLWLLHGGSAAFSTWAWWRLLMRLRWIRESDPDGLNPSYHSNQAYCLSPTKTGEFRIPGLKPVEVPIDELYLGMAKTGDVDVLMTATHEGEDYPQVYQYKNEWGGRVCGWLPGHRPEVIESSLRAMLEITAQSWLSK